VIFFVAANWQRFHELGRLGLLEAVLLAAVGVAWWRPPPHAIGSGALVFALLVTGALLALFGITYQTGAATYELFVVWALLGLPFAVAGSSGATWATWWAIVNVALALFCGWMGAGDFMWCWLDRWGMSKPLVLMVPFVV